MIIPRLEVGAASAHCPDTTGSYSKSRSNSNYIGLEHSSLNDNEKHESLFDYALDANDPPRMGSFSMSE